MACYVALRNSVKQEPMLLRVMACYDANHVLIVISFRAPISDTAVYTPPHFVLTILESFVNFLLMSDLRGYATANYLGFLKRRLFAVQVPWLLTKKFSFFFLEIRCSSG